MRTLLRGSLRRSLRTLPELDRLAAALPVVCGSALAAHCRAVSLEGGRVLQLEVSGPEWLQPLFAMRDVLQRDLAETAGVAITGLDLRLATPHKGRPERRSTPEARSAPAIRSAGIPGRRPA